MAGPSYQETLPLKEGSDVRFELLSYCASQCSPELAESEAHFYLLTIYSLIPSNFFSRSLHISAHGHVHARPNQART